MDSFKQIKLKIITRNLALILFSITILNCSSLKKDEFKPVEVYKTENLIIIQIEENSFVHTSFKLTESWGKVPCNGLIMRNNNEVIVFDTPTTEQTSTELIKWITETLHSKINAIIPTHFHDDCLGGLKAFHDNNIPSYAYFKTTELAQENDYAIPQNSFRDSLILNVGDQNIIAIFFGEGHTQDNIVGYFPSENVLFGGCLIKEKDASKGYLGDANIDDWSGTVEKIRNQYPNVKIVVPGHGNYGDAKLLDYTTELFITTKDE